MARNDAEAAMSKIIIGAVTAVLWFALSYAAHAERVCGQGQTLYSCASVRIGR
jgi:hypothetical protein